MPSIFIFRTEHGTTSSFFCYFQGDTIKVPKINLKRLGEANTTYGIYSYTKPISFDENFGFSYLSLSMISKTKLSSTGDFLLLLKTITKRV